MTNFTDIKTKKDRVSFIRFQLTNNPKWAVRGLLRIFENQTEDEKVSEYTKHDNKIGFNGTDATLLTSYAKQYLTKGYLTENQMKYVHKKMPKYAAQLERVSSK